MLIDELLSHTKAENPELRKSAVKLLAIFCIHTKADLEPYIAQLIRGLIQLMTENDPEMLLLVADAVTAVVKVCPYYICTSGFRSNFTIEFEF